MLVGLISDTHDNQARTRTALKLLTQHDPERVLHAGDLTTGATVPLFRNHDTTLVQGNMDDARSIRDAINEHNVSMTYDTTQTVHAGETTIGLIHGDDQARLEGMINSGTFDVIVHGHTHRFRDETIGPTRIINPGAVHRASTPSVCLYETETDELERLKIPS